MSDLLTKLQAELAEAGDCFPLSMLSRYKTALRRLIEVAKWAELRKDGETKERQKHVAADILQTISETK